MSLRSSVTLFPADPEHRLVGADLAAFLDRVSERLIALGDGAEATVRAGKFRRSARNVRDLVAAIDAARREARGKADLEVRLRGDVRDPFSKYLGANALEAEFRAFVKPHALAAARRCGGCGWPLDVDAHTGQASCARRGCGDGEPGDGGLRACWMLRFVGQGADGIGERFVEEARRLEGSPFFESLEGIARANLLEWHAWH
ncbi:MAG: hypothetical protein M9894_38260 [Planctomycetes bacterium]|nr:hypothetical protein [Planctomycetota bacterium]